MPNQPGTLLFPTSLDDTSSLFNAANNATTALTAAATSTDTSITVASTAAFSPTGSFTVDGEIIYYTAKFSTSFAGCTRGCEGTAAAAHSIGASAELLLTAAYHDIVTSAVVAVESKVGTGATTPVNGTVLAGTSTGVSAWTDQPRIGAVGVGIAPTASQTLVNVQGTLSATATNLIGVDVSTRFNTITGSNIYGLFSRTLFTSTTAGTQGFIYGTSSVVNIDAAASSNVAAAYGYFARLVNGSGSSGVTNFFGLRVGSPAGTVTNAYGIYLDNATGASGLNYALYSAGGPSYHAGNFGIGAATPTSLLHVGGAIATAIATKSGTTTYSVLATDSVLLGNATTAGGVTFVLPDATTVTGRHYTFKKINAANTVTINTFGSSGQTIDGAASATMTAQWDVKRVVSDGTNWLLV